MDASYVHSASGYGLGGIAADGNGGALVSGGFKAFQVNYPASSAYTATFGGVTLTRDSTNCNGACLFVLRASASSGAIEWVADENGVAYSEP